MGRFNDRIAILMGDNKYFTIIYTLCMNVCIYVSALIITLT